jgi:tRNA (mo5U34)-methyltransferase
MTTSDLEKEFAGHRWFHSIDFGEFASQGRFPPGTPQNITLFGFMDLVKHIDLAGQIVLDIGATDGLASFGMAKSGARVQATDSVDKPTFRRGREVLGFDVDYHPNTQIKDFEHKFQRGNMDMIMCAGVFYHMLNPASSIFECRKLLKDGGLLFIETPYYPNEERAAIFVNSETNMVNEAYTYSVPTHSAVAGLMKLAGFDILATRILAAPDRITILGKAVEPSQVKDRSKLLARIHEVDLCDFSFRFRDEPVKQKSTIAYTGPQDEVVIDPAKFTPQFPLHPPADKRTVGSTIWSTAGGNH